MSIHKEITFINGIKYLKNKYTDKIFFKWYWTPRKYLNGLPIIDDPISDLDKDAIKLHNQLTNPPTYSESEIAEYNNSIDQIIEKTKFVFDNITNDEKQLQRYALYRYYEIGSLNNISLSVDPKLKSKWGINFELFGAFYNTNSDYCGLFSDIEKSSCDFYTFKLKPNQIILINPPYTVVWIQISCKIIETIMKLNKHTRIYLVIPVWNIADRKKLNLKLFDDLPEIDLLKESPYMIKHELINIRFYNGIIKKEVNLRDDVHLFVFQN
jgi:hypothetical protein